MKCRISSKVFTSSFLYEYKLGYNAAKAASNINQAFGENTVNDRKAELWFEKFQSGDFPQQKSVKNDARHWWELFQLFLQKSLLPEWNLIATSF